MLIEHPLGNIFDYDPAVHQAAVIDWLDLTWEECDRPTLSKITRDGREVRIVLRPGLRLRHGDLLEEPADHSTPPIVVHVLPCPVIVARPRDHMEFAILAYELGQLHATMELTVSAIVTPPGDGQIQLILEHWQIPFETEMRRFVPSAGMSGSSAGLHHVS